METVEIPLSKSKLILTFAGAVLFVALGIWFLLKPDTFVNPILHSRVIVLIVGAASIVFFGLCAVIVFRKLFDNRLGFTIDNQGITDNSSGVSAGLIPWAEITDISTAQVHNQRFILVVVTNPEKYIEAQPGSFKRRMMKINYRIYHTPICISPNGLQCNFDELYQIILQNFHRYKG